MIRNRYLLKSFAAFFILEMIFSTVSPMVAEALTAGPTAPEYSSFEPVDTTDLVNLMSGDLVYNIPLLEVPGPAGGYPLSLSYHSGIKLDQEASWVGLGWTLNPGAINRSVNGFADDNIKSQREVKDYWEGGESITKAYTYGLSIPKTGISLSYTHARTNDTFKGFSTQGSVGVSINPLALMGFISNLSKPNSSTMSRGKINRMSDDQIKSIASSGEFATQTGPKGDFPTFSLINDHMTKPTVGMDISSNGVKSYATVAGHTFAARTGTSSQINTASTSKHIGSALIWIFSLAINKYYTRYWSDQTTALFGTGTLYPGIGNSTITDAGIGDNYNPDYTNAFQTYAFDTYDLYDRNALSELTTFPHASDSGDPTKQVGGTLPAYDQYSVTAQGLGGVMQPIIFENGDLHGQNQYLKNFSGRPALTHPQLQFKSLKNFSSDKKVDFRFLNDFSNSLTVDPSQVEENGTDFSIADHIVHSPVEGFENSNTSQKLAGSKNIEWFTNEEIANGQAKSVGFIDCYSIPTERPLFKAIYKDYLQPEALTPHEGYQSNVQSSALIYTDKYKDYTFQGYYKQYSSIKPQTVSLERKIGGFMITNESGVTYHYALPVYNSNEYTRNKLKNPRKGSATITEVKNDEPYAYTWLLTAITGPDYIDRGGTNNEGNGILDDLDWGYWVKFDYGKWTSSYQWRTPHTGYLTDLESEYESFSYGIKELYYLDAIETKSHKAFFVKSKRKDGRGVTSRLEGGSKPRTYAMDYGVPDPNFPTSPTIVYTVSPVSTLKLDQILLFDKRDLEGLSSIKDAGSKYSEGTDQAPHEYFYKGETFSENYYYSNITYNIEKEVDKILVAYHNGPLVLDDGDLEALENENYDLKDKALKAIKFNTDYTLAQGVPNSIDFLNDFNSTCYNFPGSSCDPPVTQYEFEWPVSRTPQNGGYGQYEDIPGDDSCTGVFPPDCCGVNFYSKEFYTYNFLPFGCGFLKRDFSGREFNYKHTGKLTLRNLEILGKGQNQLLPVTKFEYAKNPNYSANKFDDWGYYKSDYENSYEQIGEIVGLPTYSGLASTTVFSTHRITTESASNVDAWSLTSITSPLGAKIEIAYEPNDYSTSVYNDFYSFSIEKTERITGTSDNVKVYFKEKGISASDFFNIGQSIQLTGFLVYNLGQFGLQGYYKADHETFYGVKEITAIGSDYITINAPDLNSKLLNNVNRLVDGISYSNVTPFFVAGVIIAPQGNKKYAGGIRVSDLILHDNFGNVSTTSYLYTKPGTSTSSGITSFIPYNHPGVQFPVEVDFFEELLSGNNLQVKRDERRKLLQGLSAYQKRVNDFFKDVMTYVREAPSMGSLYEYVTVKSNYNGFESENYETHHFKTFNYDMVNATYQDDFTSSTQVRRNVTLTNTSIDVGNLLSTKYYATKDDALLSEVKYGYLYDEFDEPFESELKNTKQGLVEQAFHKHITVKEYDYDGDPETTNPTIVPNSASDKTVVTKREDRSNVLTSIEAINYKTGIKTNSETHEFDFYTGGGLKTKTVDQFGNAYFTESVPAYRVYPEMGIKVNSTNPVQRKHMLSQIASTSTYKINSDGDPIGLVAATVQTWSPNVITIDFDGVGYVNDPGQLNVWRKKANYSFIGEDLDLNIDGLYPYDETFTEFNNWVSGEPTATWRKSNEITLYNVNSSPLEAADMNNKYAATHMSLDQARVTATAANSRYNEFTYTGAEESNSDGMLANGIYLVGGLINTDENHTGFASIQVSPGITALNGKVDTEVGPIQNDILVSFWVKADPGQQLSMIYRVIPTFGSPTSFNSSPPLSLSENKKADGWYLCTTSFKTPVSGTIQPMVFEFEIQNSTDNTIFIDDLRIHPYDASMVSYVYNEWGELSHILDGNNLFTHYKYNNAGQLEEIYKETFKHGSVRLSLTKYEYANED